MHDTEMLAIVQSFEKWRQLLDLARHQTLVHSDHRNLEYFLSTPKLSRRQARWSESLGEFDFRIQHRPGRLHGKADALSRRPAYQPSRDGRLLPPNAFNQWLPIGLLSQGANGVPERAGKKVVRRQHWEGALDRLFFGARGLVHGSAGKRVRLSVKASRAVSDAEIEFTQRFGPPRLTPGEFRRAQEVLEVPVIAVGQGLVARRIEELAPFLERLDNRQHLLIVHLVVELLLRQPTRVERERSLPIVRVPLGENHGNSEVRGVCLDLAGPIGVKVGQNWGRRTGSYHGRRGGGTPLPRQEHPGPKVQTGAPSVFSSAMRSSAESLAAERATQRDRIHVASWRSVRPLSARIQHRNGRTSHCGPERSECDRRAVLCVPTVRYEQRVAAGFPERVLVVQPVADCDFCTSLCPTSPAGRRGTMPIPTNAPT